MEKFKTKKIYYLNSKKTIVAHKKIKRGMVGYGELVKMFNSLVDEANSMVRDFNRLSDNYNKIARSHNMLLDLYKVSEENNKYMMKVIDLQKADVECLRKINEVIKKKNVPTKKPVSKK